MKISKSYLLLGILVLVAGFLLFYKLGGTSLQDWDEGLYTQIYREVAEHPSLTLTLHSEPWFEKPPLGFWLGGLSYALIGNSELAIRFLPSLFALMSIVTIFFIGKKLFNEEVGFFSGLLTVCSPIFLYDHISRRGDLESGYLFLFLLSLYFFISSLKKPQHIVLSALTLSLAFMYRGAVALLLPAIIITYIFVTNSWHLYKKYYLKVFIIIVIIIMPWHLYEYLIYKNSFWGVYFFEQILSRVNIPLHNHSYPWYHYLNFIKWQMNYFLILTSIGFSLSLYYFLKLKEKKYLFLIVWLLLAIVPISLMQTKLFWYIVPTLPVLVFISLAPIFQILKNRRILYRVFVALLIIYSTFLIFIDYQQLSKTNIDGIERIAERIASDMSKQRNLTPIILISKSRLMSKGHLYPQSNYYLQIKHPEWKIIKFDQVITGQLIKNNTCDFVIADESEAKNLTNYKLISKYKDDNYGSAYLFKP